MPLDEEWVALLQSAREIGLTVDDIRTFLYKTDPFIIRKQ
ncbi:anti-repressor SinI family protein [Bacillus sp. FJAT-50079]|nr:anti-repressor SinI family protein [Bacillus sp. FJAT-50079]